MRLVLFGISVILTYSAGSWAYLMWLIISGENTFAREANQLIAQLEFAQSLVIVAAGLASIIYSCIGKKKE